jgi:putative beta-lysine N-acetyltransferase
VEFIPESMTSVKKSNTASISLYSDEFNQRLRIDNYSGDLKEVFLMIQKSYKKWVDKIIIKSRKTDVAFFESKGYHQEAFVKGYFNGEDMFFLVKYFTEGRSSNAAQLEEKKIIETILKEPLPSTFPDVSNVELATEEDADELTELYAQTFKVYPTPIGEPGYVRKTMWDGTIYVLIREQGKIVSAASAEVVYPLSNAELTDCATLPETQGKGHMKKLLFKLEAILKEKNIHCLYTIARSGSHSMNKVFYQLHYTFGGRMINNCFIYSGLEDMNVWYKMI